MPIITLTTDFGTADWFVGSMKGAILEINPQATIVDISHDVPPGDITAGAFALAASYRTFPRGTVHVAVIDPGVGSERAAIAVRTPDYTFIGPDNGVLSLALAREKFAEIRGLENETYFRKPVCPTFHGRDVFAPVAAHLSRGVEVRLVGEERQDFARLDWPEPSMVGNTLMGRIVYIDRFGNAITNIDGSILEGLETKAPKVSVRGQDSCELKRFYQEVASGQPVAVVGSSGYLEIAVNGANAAQAMGLKIGDPVGVR